METSIETKTVQVHHLTVTMTEPEWRKVLVNPRKFQGEVRKLLAGVHAGAKPKGKRAKKAPAPAMAELRAVGRTVCPECGKNVKERGLGIHMRRKHGWLPYGSQDTATGTAPDAA